MTPPRWLVIVHREQRALYGYLRQGLGRVSLVDVIFDRRQGQIEDPETSSDQAERRGSLRPRERDRWRTFGYRLVRRTDGTEGSDAASR